jgi:2-methylisocitrate lyase-like PEP mutase family enzyme
MVVASLNDDRAEAYEALGADGLFTSFPQAVMMTRAFTRSAHPQKLRHRISQSSRSENREA